MNKYIPYIIIGLLVLLFIQNFLKPNSTIPDDYVQTKIELHDLQQDYNLSVKVNNQLKIKLKTIHDEMLKKDTVISSYNKLQLDSFFTDFLK